MSSIILGFNVVFPLILYMILGIGIKRKNWLSQKTIDEMNVLVFKIFMAVLIFLNTYSVDTSTILEEENIKIICLSVTVVLMTIVIVYFGCSKLNLEVKRKAVIVQGTYRSNLALFALAITSAIYGDGGSDTVALLMVVLIPIFNISAVLILSTTVEGGGVTFKSIVYSVIKNPLVIASTLGITLSYLNIVFPTYVMDVLVGLSRVSTPLAFILLGAGLEFRNMLGNIKPILITSTIKLVIVPTVIVYFAIKLGIRGAELVSIMSCFAAPVTVASYTMAKGADVEPELAGEIVAFTTIAAMFTMFIFIVVLGNLNYL